MDLSEAPEAKPLRALWAEHSDEAFPSGVDKSEDSGADLVMLDADVAGVLTSVLGSRRPPDAKQQKLLRACLADLDRLGAEIPHQARSYFLRLQEIVDLALASRQKVSSR